MNINWKEVCERTGIGFINIIIACGYITIAVLVVMLLSTVGWYSLMVPIILLLSYVVGGYVDDY